LQPFYQYSILEPDFEQIIADKRKDFIDREALVEVLQEQYAGLPYSDATRRNIEALRNPNTFTLTTGHQLNLMGGPMYVIYKISSAIRLSQQLAEQYPDYHFVPVFWIHTEDHDFEEINHYYTDFVDKHTYWGSFNGAVGRHILEEEIEELIPKAFAANLQSAYAAGKSLAEAHRAFFFELFDHLGLVMLDPDDGRLKEVFREVIRGELWGERAFHEVNKTSEALSEAGYLTQIHAREINLFYMDDETGRNRIVRREHEGFEVLNTDKVLLEEHFAQMVAEEVEKFSPNVALRPLLQEMILPNLAYFGGWGELSYWIQLKGVFDAYGINFPLLLPRMSGTIFRAEEAKEWENLGFELSDISKPLSELYARKVEEVWEGQERLKEILAELASQMHTLSEYVGGVDATLERTMKGQEVKWQKFEDKLRKKVYKQIRRKHPEIFQRIEHLKLSIQPDYTKQERVLGIAAFSDVDYASFIRQIWRYCEPLSYTHQFIRLE